MSAAGRELIVGSGGLIAQCTDLGVPYIVRAAMLGVTLVVAWWFMHDLGFTPERGANPVAAVRTVIAGAVDGGLRNRPVRWLMLAAPFTVGVGFYAFYAFQPYLLELFGDPTLRHRRLALRSRRAQIRAPSPVVEDRRY